MSQTDLFGNIIPSSKPNKKFTLNLELSSYHDKKRKTEINASIKNIVELKSKLKIEQQNLINTKTKYDRLSNYVKPKLEKIWVSHLKNLVHILINKELSKIWENELLLALIHSEITQYISLNLTHEYISHLEHQLNSYIQISNTENSIDTIQDDVQFNADLEQIHVQFTDSNIENHLEEKTYTKSIEKYKKLYKTLLKQVHPDVLWSTSDESESKIKELNSIWEKRQYYNLLKFNHDINPDNNIKLNSDDLNLIKKQVDLQFMCLNQTYNDLINSNEYVFYIKSFYNISDRVMESNITKFLKRLDEKLVALTGCEYSNSIYLLKKYLDENRIELSETLGIKFLIEDLYHSNS